MASAEDKLRILGILRCLSTGLIELEPISARMYVHTGGTNERLGPSVIGKAKM